MKIIIRQEKKTDFKQVYDLVKEAFANAEHTDGNEQNLVEQLRKSVAYIPQLSLVAEINGELAGHIMFTKANVGKNEVLVLAPLTVKPKYQRMGVGSSLIEAGHRKAKDLGFQYVIVLGSEKYYPKFAYKPAEEFGIKVPNGIPSQNFMAIRLQDDAKPIKGKVIYAKEFGM